MNGHELTRMTSSAMTRREMLGLVASAAPLLAAAPSLLGAEDTKRKRLGVCTYSYNLHWKAAREGNPKARFQDPIEFLQYCHQLGAGGVQVAIGPRDAGYATRLRTRTEALGMYLEGESSLPKQESDVARFDGEVHAAKEAGAEVVRTAMLGGRRYETFDSAVAFRQFTEQSWKSLTLAEPVARRHGIKLAVENHKDWRAPGLVDILKRFNSDYVDLCVDNANNIGMYEDPQESVVALATF